jgi:hypothetical protein
MEQSTHTCTRKAMSTTNVVITPITSPKTPLATVEEPISISTYRNTSHVGPYNWCWQSNSREYQVLKKFGWYLLLGTWDHGYSCNQLLFPISTGCFQHSAGQSMSPACLITESNSIIFILARSNL